VEKTSDLIWQDAQHQVLFELIDLIKTATNTYEVYNRLKHYMENHFSLEELYMERIQYPHIKAHIAAHNKFRDELEQMLEPHAGFDDDTKHSVSLFLKEWLTRHVLGIDKDLEKFILDSNVK